MSPLKAPQPAVAVSRGKDITKHVPQIKLGRDEQKRFFKENTVTKS